MTCTDSEPGGQPLFEATDLRFGYSTRLDFLGPVNLEVRPGQCWAIVGPNGAGKTTLLRLMAGLIRPRGGSVRLNGVDLEAISPRHRARRIAFVPQHAAANVHQSVREIVLLGRYPHRPLSLFESVEDHRVAEEAMRITSILEFADRTLATLSGGEAQRVHIAASLAQQPSLLLLDEPTASLDLRQQLVIFDILRRRAVEDNVTVVVVTHDVNLAARYCSHVVLLDDGKVAAVGPPEAVVTPDVLEPVYGVKMMALGGEESGPRWIVPVKPVSEGGP